MHPANVMLKKLSDEEVVAKLSYLGLAESLAFDGGELGFGSRCYRAPEVLLNRLSKTGDVFSLGALMVFVFGRHHKEPFEDVPDETIEEMMKSAMESGGELQMDELEDVDDVRIYWLARQCLLTVPDQRPTIAEVLHRLRWISGSRAVRPSPQAPTWSVRALAEQYQRVQAVLERLALCERRVDEHILNRSS